MDPNLTTDYTPYMLAGIAALAFAALGYWVAWISTSLNEEAQRFDSRQLGLLIIMLPIARRLGNYSEAVRLMPLQQYEKWRRET
jgi:hypothetical protein